MFIFVVKWRQNLHVFELSHNPSIDTKPLCLFTFCRHCHLETPQLIVIICNARWASDCRKGLFQGSLASPMKWKEVKVNFRRTSTTPTFIFVMLSNKTISQVIWKTVSVLPAVLKLIFTVAKLPFDKTKHSFPLLRQRSTTVYLETNSLIQFANFDDHR